MQEFKTVIGILLISTRLYKQFVQPVINSIDEYFLTDYPKVIFVFTDEYRQDLKSNNKIEQILIPNYKFPYATLYRYKVFCQNQGYLRQCDFLAYMDVDMKVCAKVDSGILYNELTMVYHPGFYSKKEQIGHWGSNGVIKESTAWIEPEKRFGYVAGGFLVGKTEWFLLMSHVINKNIDIDEGNGIIAEWNDESHQNAFLKNNPAGMFVKILDPSYCMVEQKHLREAWGISELEPKIIALEKNHELIRN